MGLHLRLSYRFSFARYNRQHGKTRAHLPFGLCHDKRACNALCALLVKPLATNAFCTSSSAASITMFVLSCIFILTDFRFCHLRKRQRKTRQISIFPSWKLHLISPYEKRVAKCLTSGQRNQIVRHRTIGSVAIQFAATSRICKLYHDNLCSDHHCHFMS